MACERGRGKIAVVGSGLIGKSWTMVFVSGGFSVCLYDIEPEQTSSALTYIADKLHQLEKDGLLHGDSCAEHQCSRITTTTDLESCVKDAIHIQECIYEKVEMKTKLFTDVGKMLTEGVTIASSSGNFPPSRFTENMENRHQAMVIHPINPPYFVPLVELVPSPWTEPALVDSARRLMQSVGQLPVTLKKEIPGFAVVRTQNAIIQQAMKLVVDGVISVEDIDKIMHHGLGMRYAFMGPFSTKHLNHPGGFVTCNTNMIYNVSMASGEAVRLDSKADTGLIQEGLCQFSPLDKLDDRRQWRDRRVTALAKLKKQMDKDYPWPKIEH